MIEFTKICVFLMKDEVSPTSGEINLFIYLDTYYVGESIHDTIGYRGTSFLCIFERPYNLGGLLAEGFGLAAWFLGMRSFFSISLVTCSTFLSFARVGFSLPFDKMGQAISPKSSFHTVSCPLSLWHFLCLLGEW